MAEDTHLTGILLTSSITLFIPAFGFIKGQIMCAWHSLPAPLPIRAGPSGLACCMPQVYVCCQSHLRVVHRESSVLSVASTLHLCLCPSHRSEHPVTKKVVQTLVSVFLIAAFLCIGLFVAPVRMLMLTYSVQIFAIFRFIRMTFTDILMRASTRQRRRSTLEADKSDIHNPT